MKIMELTNMLTHYMVIDDLNFEEVLSHLQWLGFHLHYFLCQIPTVMKN